MMPSIRLKISLFICLTGIPGGMTQEIDQTNKMIEKLKYETDLIKQLKLELQLTKAQLLTQKKVDCVVSYYKKAGTFDRWKLSREYILDWFIYCDKWKFIAGDDNKHNMTDIMIGIIHNETNGDAKCKTYEPNKTYSYGITQINDACVKIIESELDMLYPELKGRDIKMDAEKNIAGRYLWIKHRKDSGRSWALMGNGWTLYWFLSQVKL